MVIIIEWSELAEKQLKDIYDYYALNANSKIARKIVNSIIKRVDILFKNPLSGQKEELLLEYPEEFRYLVQGNYKIIYWKENECVTIASVFDCRQNPIRIMKI